MAPVESFSQLVARHAAEAGYNLLVPRKGGGGKGGGGGGKGSGSKGSGSKGKSKGRGGVIAFPGGTGGLIGLIIGVIILIIIALVLFYFWRKHNQKKKDKDAADDKVAKKESALEDGEASSLVAGQEGQHQAAHLSSVPYQGGNGAAADYYSPAPPMSAQPQKPAQYA